jgi:hypothetical protein
MEKTTVSMMNKALQVAYEKAISGFEVKGVKLLDSAYDLAKSYANPEKTVKQNATSLVNWQCSKAGASGFATSFGGFATMAVGVPANITSVLYVQLRMIAAIAIMAGYDPRQDQVQTLAYTCLLGSAAGDVIRDAGIKITEKVTENYIKRTMTRAVTTKINQKVGFRLITKAGSKGVLNMTKMIPVVGAVFGASFDIVTTKTIGATAKKMFIDGKVG